MIPNQQLRLPFKSVAGALLLGLFFGPVGLLYATTWGGVVMLVLGIAIVPTKLPVPIAIIWLSCCVWGVVAANRFNQKLIQKINNVN